MRSFLIHMMSPISSQPNLSKSFRELSFTVFSIYSKARTSTGSSIPREAAVTCARVGSICIVTCRTAVTLVTWRAFVDIWSKENFFLESTVGFWSFWNSGPVKFRILMLYSHDVTRLQQKQNISSTRFSGLLILVTEHAWYCGTSNT